MLAKSVSAHSSRVAACDVVLTAHSRVLVRMCGHFTNLVHVSAVRASVCMLVVSCSCKFASQHVLRIKVGRSHACIHLHLYACASARRCSALHLARWCWAEGCMFCARARMCACLGVSVPALAASIGLQAYTCVRCACAWGHALTYPRPPCSCVVLLRRVCFWNVCLCYAGFIRSVLGLNALCHTVCMCDTHVPVLF
jgi:hypothetical protein